MGVKFFTFYRALLSPVSGLGGALGLARGFVAVVEELLYSHCCIQGSRSVPAPPDPLVWAAVALVIVAAAKTNSELWLSNASNAPCFTG